MKEGNYEEAYPIFQSVYDGNAELCKAMMEGRYKDAVKAGLQDIVIPDGVTSIDCQAFWGCDCLTSITIPNSVTTICDQAFDRCEHLTRITYTGTKAQWQAINKGWRWNPDVVLSMKKKHVRTSAS